MPDMDTHGQDEMVPPRVPDDNDTVPGPKAIREGLPSTYRMRADRHYVEQLDGPASGAVEAPAVILRSAAVAASVETPSLDVHDDVLRALRSIESCTHLLPRASAALPQSVATDLIRAEVWRTSVLLEASRVVQDALPPGPIGCSVRRLVSEVAERAEPALRLHGCTLHVDNEIPEAISIAADPRMIATALSGLVVAMRSAVDGIAGVRLGLSASMDATRQVELAVTEIGARVHAAWETRAFDDRWHERPGGVPSAVCMLAARKIAEAFGGRLMVSVNPRGAAAKMVLPLAAA
jgi:hypothetical protein